MAASRPSNTFLQRLVGAAALDAAIYEEVEADRGATTQAMTVVVLSSLAAGVGSHVLSGTTVANVTFFTVVALMAWAAWALVTFEIGARLLPEPQTQADVGELLRTIGFAATPGILRVFGILPFATIPIFVITAFWMLAATIVAVRQALDYTSTLRAIAVCVLGWVLALAFAVTLGMVFGPSVS